MEENKTKIRCSIFQKQEVVIKEITDRINKSRVIQEKVKFTLELQKEVDMLLSCPDYDGKSLECKNCHFIANLRTKTANLIIKAKKLV